MKRVTFPGAAVLVLLVAGTLAGQADIDVILDQLTGETPVESQTEDAMKKAQLAAFKYLLNDMGAENPLDRAEPQTTFEKICHYVSRPGADPERSHWCRLMCGGQNRVIPQPSRIWMLRKLIEIGGGESVAALAELLDSPEPQVRELARRALERNPDERATTALIDALKRTTHPDDEIAYLNALGGRGDATILDAVAQRALSENDNVARAALAATGDIGGDRALSILMEIHNAGGPERYAAAAAALRVAQRDVSRQRAAFAQRDILRDDSPVTIRIACLAGLAQSDPSFCFEQVKPIIQGARSPGLRQFAIGLVRTMEDPGVLPALCQGFDAFDTEGQVLLLAMFADRGDPSTRETVLAALEHSEPRVRSAALEALTHLAHPSDVPAIARVASRDRGVRKVARSTLERLRGAETDQVIRDGIRSSEAAEVRAEYIRAATARGDRRAIALLQEVAGGDDATLQAAAIDGLAVLCESDHVEALLPLLGEGSGERVRRAAEAAIAQLCRKDSDETRRVKPILRLAERGDATTRASAIRILGRVQGAAAIPAVRAGLDRDGPVREASIRALAGWDTPAVLPELMRAAQSDAPRAQRVVALRGYLRLLKEPSARGDLDTLKLVKAAFPVANRADERRMALSVIGTLGIKEALTTAEAQLDNRELQSEAAQAVADIAGRVSASDAAVAQAALERLSRRDLDDRLRGHIERIQSRIAEHRGYVGAWRYAGPYRREGVSGTVLLSEVFAPEGERASEVDWKPLRTSNPWVIDFTEIDPGTQRVIYVTAHVHSDREREVVFAMGSDDGLRVRVNDDLVHEKAVMRGLNRGEDKVKVTLREGTNIIEAKIAQGGGGWGFCLRIEDENGQPAEGLQVLSW